MKTVERVVGVDFSGARLAGRNAWVAECEVVEGERLRLGRLESLGTLAGTDERDAALAWLVDAVRGSEATLWAMDFPFGLPIELGLGTWREQLELVNGWQGGAHAFGVHCLDVAKALGGRGHIRRRTDVEQRAPFDCYHYRIVYQTFHGMRDVLGPLSRDGGVAVLPLERAKLGGARAVVAEACPSSTLKRLGLPHQKYKQAAGGPLTPLRRRTRRAVLDAVRARVGMDDRQGRRIMRNPGGDALDAVLAAIGGWHGWHHQPLRAGGDGRYAREGMIVA